MSTATLEKVEKGLSQKQMFLFWRLFQKAFANQNGVQKSTQEKEKWRHELIERVTDGACRSTKTMTSAQYEDVMLELAAIADDEKAVGYWTSCTERRYRFLIRGTLKEMNNIHPDGKYDWDYVKRVFTKSKLPYLAEDTPAKVLREVFQMLDTHCRRLRRQWREEQEEAPF